MLSETCRSATRSKLIVSQAYGCQSERYLRTALRVENLTQEAQRERGGQTRRYDSNVTMENAWIDTEGVKLSGGWKIPKA